jgi:hypothetical protein
MVKPQRRSRSIPATHSPRTTCPSPGTTESSTSVFEAGRRPATPAGTGSAVCVIGSGGSCSGVTVAGIGYSVRMRGSTTA